MNGPVKALLRGHVADDEGVRRLFQLPCTIVPGLGGNLFSVKQAARNGVVCIFGITNPSLEKKNHTLPLQELGYDLCLLLLCLAGGGNGLAMLASANANLGHRRLGHLNRNSLSLLKRLGNNGAGSEGPVANCNVCAMGKSRQLARFKTANHRLAPPFQLGFADLILPLTPQAFGGYPCSTNVSDKYTKLTDPYLSKSTHDALSPYKVYIPSVCFHVVSASTG